MSPVHAGYFLKEFAMRVITKKRIQEFATIHTGAAAALSVFHKLIIESQFSGPSDLQRTFGQVDYVKGLYVFNIGTGYRLIAAIHFHGQRLYVRHVLTHAEYDRGKWKPK